MRELRGYMANETSGAFPWPGSLDKLEAYVKDIRGQAGTNILYWTEEVESSNGPVKLVVWKVE